MKHPWRERREKDGEPTTPIYVGAFNSGYHAFKERMLPSDNPYISNGGVRMQAWDAGYEEARMEMRNAAYIEGLI